MLFSVSERARTGTDHVAPVPARLLAAPARPSAVPAQLVRDVLHGSGQPPTMSLKEEMEGRLGADFSNVRVHTGEAARASAAEIGARAYTVGNHVVIGDGGADKHMLAHELTHVIQQRSGPVAGADRGGGLKVSDPSDRDERTAVANAARVMRAPLNENRLARAGTGEPGTGERGIGAAELAAVPPIVVQRYFYDIPAVHGENPEIKGKTVDVLPASRQRYEDDYDPLRALNLRRKHREQMHEPVRNQIFIDNPAYASRMRGYLKDTVMESKRVAGAANAVLTGLREHLKHHPDFSRSMMIGVIETLDGNLRVANSGGTSGPVNDIVRDLDKVSGAAMKAREDQEREPNEPLRKARKNPKDVGSRVSVVDPVSTENFESYLKAGRSPCRTADLACGP